jgi:hypothetical protein
MKGMTIPEIAEKDIRYLTWARDNMYKMPASALIKKYLSERNES